MPQTACSPDPGTLAIGHIANRRASHRRVGSGHLGTLLQRRIPTHRLVKISSFDSFVLLALMPVSKAVAGPLAQVMPLWGIFMVAGIVSPLFGAIA